MKGLLLRSTVVALLALPLSGCFLRTLLGGSDEFSPGRQVAGLSADSEIGFCFLNDETGFVNCTYSLFDEEGFIVDLTSSSALISEFGLFGVIIDPLVLEVPGDFTDFSGTYHNALGDSGDLIIHPGLAFVPADDDDTFVASPGTQLVVVELPEGVPVNGVEYTFDLSFERDIAPGTGGPVEVKAVLTGRVPIDFGAPELRKTYYPPVLPCETDLANVPSITLPQSSVQLPLSVPLTVSGCQNELYTFIDPPLACDQDNDGDVDRVDLALIMAMRNTPVAAGDPRDFDGSGVVNANDARACARNCTRRRCAA